MSVRPLYHGQPGTTSAVAYSSTNVATTFSAFTVVNTTAGAETLTAWITDEGVAVADGSLLFEGLSVPANDQAGVQVAVAHTMGVGQDLHLQASAAGLVVRISGEKHS